MIRIIIILIIVFTMFSCSPQAKLKRNFVGENLEEVTTEYGAPVQKIMLENGNQLMIYKKETPIRATVIDSGQDTLDPRISPGYTKIEWFKFELNNKGIIVRTSYETEIER